MPTDGQRTKRRRNIAENYNRLSTVHERYRQTTDRRTDRRQHLANVNVSSRLRSRSLKSNGCLRARTLRPVCYSHSDCIKRTTTERF